MALFTECATHCSSYLSSSLNNMRNSIFIRRIIQHPFQWPVLTFVSSIAGLICFPISTTFQDWFGHPTFMKLSLYFSLVTLILCAFLFTMIREPLLLGLQFTKTWWFKAQISFAAIIVPFFNTFVKDQREEEGMNEEKWFGRLMDLFTTGSFSLTALSLTKEVWLGVGTTIFNSFLGALLLFGVTLGWKIGLPLAISLCYLLILTRFYVDDHYHNNNNPSPRALEHVETGNMSNYSPYIPVSDNVFESGEAGVDDRIIPYNFRESVDEDDISENLEELVSDDEISDNEKEKTL